MHKFRTQLLATVSTVALTSGAYAADMPVKAPPPAPVPYVANWTGFYAGLQIGGASFEPSCQTNLGPFADTEAVFIDPCVNDFEGKATGSLSSASVIGGGKIGYDYQWDRVVLGVVGEFDWTDLHGSTQFTSLLIDPGAAVTASARIDWLASARGRIGWAFGNFLAYGTGGIAWTQIKTSIGVVPGANDIFPAISAGGTSSRTGGVAGAGFEYRVAPHVSVVGEVLWYGFGSTTLNEVCPSSSSFCGTGHTYTTSLNHEDILTGTLGVNWRF